MMPSTCCASAGYSAAARALRQCQLNIAGGLAATWLIGCELFVWAMIEGSDYFWQRVTFVCMLITGADDSASQCLCCMRVYVHRVGCLL
jgi:hypothetical protein